MSDNSPASPEERVGLGVALGFGCAVGALMLFSFLADSVLRGATREFDEAVRASIHSLASPALTYFMKIITLLGSGMLLLPMGVLIGALFLWAGYRRVVWFFAITMGGAVALEHILKATFHRLRPAPFFDIAPPSSYSFPSGHALASFCFYGVLVALWSHRLASRAQRTGIWLVAAILIALIGVSRIYLGVHYPSDVIAGYAAALVWVMVMSFADEALRKRTRKRRGDEAHASLR